MLSDKENKIKVSLWKKNHDKACSIKPPQSMFEKQFSDAEFLIIQKKKKKETRAIRYNVLEYDQNTLKF